VKGEVEVCVAVYVHKLLLIRLIGIRHGKN
jgi:hypothetical protein